MSISKTQLGHAVRQIRELRGYSQAELGHKSGLQPNTIALIERGERGVSLDAVNKLASALAIPAGCLTMLGTIRIRGDSEGAAMVKSMQELILATLFAQTQLEAKEEAEKLTRAKVEAIQSRRDLQTIAQRGTVAKKTRKRSAGAKTTARAKS
jgi:transcriptional regulator with XRE-family HTH domain